MNGGVDSENDGKGDNDDNEPNEHFRGFIVLEGGCPGHDNGHDKGGEAVDESP